MKSFYIFLILFISLINQSYGVTKSNTTTKENHYEWLILVYMNGDSNLEIKALIDFFEMSNANQNNNIKIVIRLNRGDRDPASVPFCDNWTGTQEFVMEENLLPTGGTKINSPFLNKETIRDFIIKSKEKFPFHNKMAFIYWDHGSFYKSTLFDKKAGKQNSIDKAYISYTSYMKDSQDKLDQYINDYENEIILKLNKLKVYKDSILNNQQVAIKNEIQIINKSLDSLNNYFTDDCSMKYLKRFLSDSMIISKKDFIKELKDVSPYSTISVAKNRYKKTGKPFTIKDFKKSISSNSFNIENEINLIAFDACSLSFIESLPFFWENKKLEFIASQINIPTDGLNYTHLINSLSNRNQSLGENIVNTYKHSYGNFNSKEISISHIKMIDAEKVVDNLNNWIKFYMKNKKSETFKNALLSGRRDLVSYESGYEGSIDLVTFLKNFTLNLNENQTQDSIMKEKTRILIESIENKKFLNVYSNKPKKYYGLSIYFPDPRKSYDLNKYKNNFLFSKKCKWYKIIKQYKKIKK